MGNSFGSLFRISSWGESHGGGIGVVIDGCPPKLPLSLRTFNPPSLAGDLGQSKLTTPEMKRIRLKSYRVFLKEYAWHSDCNAW